MPGVHILTDSVRHICAVAIFDKVDAAFLFIALSSAERWFLVEPNSSRFVFHSLVLLQFTKEWYRGE